MLKIIRYGMLILFLCAIYQPAFAGELLEPEILEVSENWLTSDAQSGVDYHIFKVCRDEEMTKDCSQATYKAKDNGAVRIPANNRCIYRVLNATSYTLYYQIKSASIDGAQSQMTSPRKVLVYREYVNLGTQSYSYLIVNYEITEATQ
jgi:hypothetical protein